MEELRPHSRNECADGEMEVWGNVVIASMRPHPGNLSWCLVFRRGQLR